MTTITYFYLKSQIYIKIVISFNNIFFRPINPILVKHIFTWQIYLITEFVRMLDTIKFINFKNM